MQLEKIKEFFTNNYNSLAKYCKTKWDNDGEDILHETFLLADKRYTKMNFSLFTLLVKEANRKLFDFKNRQICDEGFLDRIQCESEDILFQLIEKEQSALRAKRLQDNEPLLAFIRGKKYVTKKIISKARTLIIQSRGDYGRY